MIDIVFTGDFCLDGGVEKSCLSGKLNALYGDSLPLLKDKDLSITNMECPLTRREDPIVKLGPNLKADPRCIDAVTYGGFDVAALANNHILDQNENGVMETISVCNGAGVKTVGAGADLQEASNPLIVEVKGRKIAILNFVENEFSIAEKDKAGANPMDPVRNYYRIEEAKRIADIVFVIAHGGHERYALPSRRMVELFRFFADRGAAAVICHHTHCPSGYEIHNGAPIFYGLGNFIFDRPDAKSIGWNDGFFIKLGVEDDAVKKIDLFPYQQCLGRPGLKMLRGEAREKFIAEIDGLSEVIRDEKSLESRWAELRESREYFYMSTILGLGKYRRQFLKNKYSSRLFVRKKKLLGFLSMFRCEAHRELMIDVIGSALKKMGLGSRNRTNL